MHQLLDCCDEILRRDLTRTYGGMLTRSPGDPHRCAREHRRQQLSDKVESVPTWRFKIGTTLVMIERMAHVFRVWRMAGFARFCVREAGNPRRSVYELRSSSFCLFVGA